MSLIHIIELPSNISINNILTIYFTLKSDFENFREIDIDCSEIDRCDISSVQLLISAQNSAVAKGLILRLSGVSGALMAVLTRAGFALAPSGDRIVINEG